MTRNEFFNYLQKHYPWVNDETFHKIDIYTETLREYNEKFNLTRLDSEDKIYGEYYLGSIINFSSLAILKDKQEIKVLDIGSGSGIPGILLKLIFPWIQLTIIESNNKKCLFMSILADKLNIPVKIVNERAEIYFRQLTNGDSFDLVTSRAVASIDKILELSIPFLKVHGNVFLLKSKGYEQELASAANCMSTLSCILKTVDIQEFESKTYVGLLFEKMQKTSEIYPREWRLIVNKPL